MGESFMRNERNTVPMRHIFHGKVYIYLTITLFLCNNWALAIKRCCRNPDEIFVVREENNAYSCESESSDYVSDENKSPYESSYFGNGINNVPFCVNGSLLSLDNRLDKWWVCLS
jgi:hypothetical protein